ncbi:Fe2+-enterobactin ABC transporter substrate-binding protein [Actinomyces wuliandei]|uniref:Fe2+-enterobactin ABC transporter substrate-binding protein n=1 Tax=Actinomyces wuliandei TaxID=2057743 RepID=UPI000FDC1289|nr:Fe2+-enterobactin ABC transporter substrate-binding protein [Actinomyces wuliandei]
MSTSSPASSPAARRPRRGLDLLLPVVAALLVAVLLAVGLTACGSGLGGSDDASGSAGTDQAVASASADGGWPRTVQTDDDTDAELTLDAQPETIVSTSVTLTGSLLAVGAPVVASGATAPDQEGLSDSSGFFLQWSDVAQEQGVEVAYENSAPEAESVAQYSPDLIVVAKTGGDSAMDIIDQLRDVAPVLVVDYGTRSWQDVTTLLGEATGQEEQAEEVVSDFDSKVAQAKESVTVPEGDTSAFIVAGDDSGDAMVLTEESPQVQLLTELGFTMAAVPDDVQGEESMGERGDIIELSGENVQKGLVGENWVVVAADQATRDTMDSNEAYTTAAPVRDDKVSYMPSTTFRLDYYSAQEMLDALTESYSG